MEMMHESQSRANHIMDAKDSQHRQELKDLQGTMENFDALFDEAKFEKLRGEDKFRLSHKALLSALFIKQYSKSLICSFGKP